MKTPPPKSDIAKNHHILRQLRAKRFSGSTERINESDSIVTDVFDTAPNVYAPSGSAAKSDFDANDPTLDSIYEKVTPKKGSSSGRASTHTKTTGKEKSFKIADLIGTPSQEAPVEVAKMERSKESKYPKRLKSGGIKKSTVVPKIARGVCGQGAVIDTVPKKSPSSQKKRKGKAKNGIKPTEGKTISQNDISLLRVDEKSMNGICDQMRQACVPIVGKKIQYTGIDEDDKDIHEGIVVAYPKEMPKSLENQISKYKKKHETSVSCCVLESELISTYEKANDEKTRSKEILYVFSNNLSFKWAYKLK